MAEPRKRLLPCIISAIMDLYKTAPSPSIYKKWGALSAVSSVMTRRTWTSTINGVIYPNMAIIFVGQPGTGKGPTIDPIETLLRQLDFSSNPLRKKEGIRIGPNDTTAPGLFDELLAASSNKTFLLDGQEQTFQSLVLISEELAAFLHSLDLRMMGYLIRLLNCQPISQRLRKQDALIEVVRPVISILGGVQPDTLNEIFPQSAWGMGLTARTIFVFSDEEQRVPVFRRSDLNFNPEEFKARPLFKKIVEDLAQVARLSGPFSYAKRAAERIDHWWLEGEAERSRPSHPRLKNYSGKRIFHLLRLSMVHCASRTNDMIIEAIDVEKAISDLLEVEKVMPSIFSTMMGIDSQACSLEDITHQISSVYITTGNPIPHHILLSIISQKVPLHSINNVLTLLIDQNILSEVQLEKRYPGAGGRKGYIPAQLQISI